ncbi:MAG TPA: glycosyltransferase family 1 protein, partial [Thermoanaerobaculia bacterium]|nr:glycosyltransferase family 1 protein [Thermoanaerobaculia bacterium]
MPAPPPTSEGSATTPGTATRDDAGAGPSTAAPPVAGEAIASEAVGDPAHAAPPRSLPRRLLSRCKPHRVVYTLRWFLGEWRRMADRRREQRVTVAVDVTPLWESLTGVGWYLERLLVHLAGRDDLRLRLYGPTVTVDPNDPGPVQPLPTGPALEPVRIVVPEDLTVPAGPLIRVLRRLEPLLIAADGNRVLWAPNFFPPRRFLLARGALVATVHDLAWRRLPWTLREETLADLSLRLEQTAYRARYLVTPSRAVRGELAAAGIATPEQVLAIHHGPGHLSDGAGTAARAAGESGLDGPYVLFVGTIEPRKNLGTLLAAWRLLAGQHRGAAGDELPRLVVCGRVGWKSERLAERLREGEASGWVVHLGYVETERLEALYRGAVGLAFPTFYEGFGLPALEAMAAGIPLVLSDIPVLREVAGDAALYAPPEEPAAWARQVARL